MIVFDGGSLGNPGKGYGSYILTNPTGVERHQALEFESTGVTNNQAEYRTLLDALRVLSELLGDRAALEHVRVEGDSKLVLNQVSGKWKTKDAGLKPLRRKAADLTSQFASVEFQWHDRSRSVELLGH